MVSSGDSATNDVAPTVQICALLLVVIVADPPLPYTVSIRTVCALMCVVASLRPLSLLFVQTTRQTLPVLPRRR